MNTLKHFITIALVLALEQLAVNAQDIFPAPQSFSQTEGSFQLGKGRILIDAGAKNELHAIVVALKDRCNLKKGVSLSITSALAKNEQAQISILIDSKVVLKSQGYKLNITKNGVRITANNKAGAFYAVQSLLQIVKFSKNAALPLVTIEDRPDFERRGMMIDVSRNKVPSMETLKRTIDRFASWKINEVQLYIEHTFAYKNHETVWKGYSPLTAENIMELDKYCKERFIDLVPNQNSLGHMGYWLKHDAYLYLSERPGDASSDDWIINNRRSTLCAVDRHSVEFMDDLLSEYLPNFSSSYANIGGDEPYELGTGKSAEACKEQGKALVYLNYIKKMNKLVKQNGKSTQMWGDIVNKHPELIPLMPKDISCLIWGYRPEHPFNVQCPRFQQEGIPFYVCPGSNSWRSFIGKTDRAMANITNAVSNGKKYGAYGVLMTDWGDMGHMQPFTVAFPAYLYAAGMAWSVEQNSNANITELLNTHVFFDESQYMGKALMTLSNAYKGGHDEEVSAPYFSMINKLLVPFKDDYVMRQYDMSKLKDVRAQIAKAVALLKNAKPTAYDGQVAMQEMKTAAKLADIMCLLLIERSKAKDNDLFNISFSKRKKYAAQLDLIIAEQAATWVLRNRTGGLHDSNKRLIDISNILKAKDKASCTVVQRIGQ